VFTQSVAQVTTALPDVMENAPLMENVTMMDAATILTARSTVMDSAELMESVPIRVIAVVMLIVGIAEFVETISPALFLNAAQILTALPNVEGNVELMALAHIQSAAKIPTASMLMESAMSLHHMMETSVTTAMAEAVFLAVPMMG